jgi:hypothetical protein
MVNAAWRIRATMSTDQSTVNAIPIWFFIFDNFYLATPNIGNNYGGFHWVIDNLGGSAGIGRAQGRTQYDFWFNPNATPTSQWQTGAFAPAADAVNDIRLQFQIIDADQAAHNTDLDSGTICIEEISVYKQDRDSMQFTTVFNPPIDSSTHIAFDGLAGGPAAVASIDGNTNEATLGPATSTDDRADLSTYDPDGDGIPGPDPQFDDKREFFPVTWTADTVYRNRSSIRAATSTTDPVDAIFLVLDMASVEIGTFSYTTRTGNGVMVFAASPSLTDEEYEAYIYSQNLTLATPLNQNTLLRPQTFVFNTTGLFGTGTGGDDVVVSSQEVDTIVSD